MADIIRRSLLFILRIFNAVTLFVGFGIIIFLLSGFEIWGNIELTQLYTFLALNFNDVANGDNVRYILKISGFYSGVATFLLLLILKMSKKSVKSFIPALYVFIYALVVLFAVKYFSLADTNDIMLLSFALLLIYSVNLRRAWTEVNIAGAVVLFCIFINNFFAVNYSDYRISKLMSRQLYVTELSKDKMIAHGGGGIEGLVYTNSMEALEQSAERGYKYIEIDLLKYSDNSVGFFGAHDYDKFKNMTGIDEYTEEKISSGLILGKYTPLTDKNILSFFENHPDIWLVTDKVDDYDMLNEKLGKLKDRTISEFFTLEQYNNAVRCGFKHNAYNVTDVSKLKFAEDNKFEYITMDTEFLEKYRAEIQKVRHKTGIKVMVYTAENKEDAGRYSYFADMIYYDGEENINR